MTDLVKILGVETTVITSQEVCVYRIWCPECGDKFATWLIDNPEPKLIKDTFDRQYSEVTFPTHIEHGTITIIDEWHHLRGIQ